MSNKERHRKYRENNRDEFNTSNKENPPKLKEKYIDFNIKNKGEKNT